MIDKRRSEKTEEVFLKQIVSIYHMDKFAEKERKRSFAKST